MDHIIQMKDILITEGQTPVNGQRVIINAIFIYNKYVWIIYSTHIIYTTYVDFIFHT